MLRRLFITLSAVCLMVLSLSVTQAQNTPLKVVATFSILGDIVKNVGGDKVDLSVLVGPDGDTHTYEPVPGDSVKLAEANLIFENGFGFESWLDKLYEASASKATRVVVTQNIEPGKIAVGDETGETDPHAWQNVYYGIHMTKIVRDALSAADPANAVTYQLNANQYITQLLDLDTYILQKVQSLPVEQRKLVTNHDAFGYFAARYGFTVVGTALGSISTEAADPSAADIAKLVEDIKSTGTKAIFPENIENPKLIQQIADQAGVKVGPSLYSDALGQPGTDGETYLKMMRYNIDAMVGALS